MTQRRDAFDAGFDMRIERVREVFAATGHSTESKRQYRRFVRWFYAQRGRVHPWRDTGDWYEVLVSELMLQQTQVERVLPKYQAFLARFPTADSLARASLSEVLGSWQGLGYNRRAKHLQECCRLVLAEHGSSLPRDEKTLRALPGVGSYVAAALQAFVFERPVVVIETNIRSVFVHCFLWDERELSETMIAELAAFYLDRRKPREWYYALMDIGSYLKRRGFRYNQRFAHYRPQSRFEGSNRQLRGRIIRLLSQQTALSSQSLIAKTDFPPEQVVASLERLRKEGLVLRQGRKYVLPQLTER